jgi:predicted phosphodiesterase
MRYAIISDLHANWQAWAAVVEDIRENKADTIICLGDVVGYGPRPEEVLASVRQHTANFVIGNHDAAACGQLDASIFNDHAREVVEWTAQRLSPDSINFLQKVPLTIRTEDILFVHAEVQDPGRFGYIETEEAALMQFMYTRATIVFFGHTHRPLAYCHNADSIKCLPDSDFHLAPGHRYLVNVGSAGEPRDPTDIRARYVLYDSSSRAVYFRKVRFDVDAYRADLKAVNLNIQPYFLSIIDHEASQGRDVFERMKDHMMTVPEKAIFKGNQTVAQNIVIGDTSRKVLVPPAAVGISVPISQSRAPRLSVPIKPKNQVSTDNSNFKFVLFLLGVLLIGLTIALLIIF